MITEQLVNLCNLLILSDNSAVTPSVIRDIDSLINSQKLEDVPVLFRKKFELCQNFCKEKIKDYKCDSAHLLDKIQTSGHFNDINDYVTGLSERKLEPERIKKAVDAISVRKSYLQIDDGGKQLDNFLKKYRNNDYANPDDAIKEWTNLIGNIQTDIIKKQRDRDLNSITQLDLSNDDFSPVINQIKVSYSGLDSVPSGYSELDKHINGGFAPARLYIFGATSGGGKSVMLINLVKNAVENCKKRDGEVPTFVYVTLENLIDETLMRLYCCLTEQSTKKVMANFDGEKEKIPQVIKTWLANNGCNIIFIYKKPQMTTSTDIMGYCDQIIANSHGASIKGIYVDYLDLMKANRTTNYDAYRLELGDITMDLKVMAVLTRCPVLTVTQLTRGSYNSKEQMTLANVGESMKKVDNADFVALFQTKDQENEKTGNIRYNEDEENQENELILTIKKNRSGAKDRSIGFKAMFSKFLIKQQNESDCLDVTIRNLGDDIDLDASVGRLRQKYESSIEGMNFL